MEETAYLERLSEILSRSFDLYRPYTIEGREYPAYGYFFSLNEKYVATRKINLWSARVYEHLVILSADVCNMDTIAQADALIRGYMESELVRKGEKVPEKDHMISYITVCILSGKTPSEETVKAVKSYRFEKSYLFTFRGRSEGRLICVDLEREKVFGNRSSRQVLNIYTMGFDANRVQR